MARLISLEDIRRRYTMAAREGGREGGGLLEERMGVRARARRGRGRRCLLPKTNWEALKISQSRPRPILESRSRRCYFFPSPSPRYPRAQHALPFRLARHFAVPLLPAARFLLPRLFHNNTPAAISCTASTDAPASGRVVVFYSDSK